MERKVPKFFPFSAASGKVPKVFTNKTKLILKKMSIIFLINDKTMFPNRNKSDKNTFA